MSEEKNPGGRPTKYKEEYCQMLIDHMEQGLSYQSFAGAIGVTRDCLYKWFQNIDKFQEAREIGKSKLLLTMEKMGLAAMSGQIKNFNASTYIFTMKNKTDWTDVSKTEISGPKEFKLSYKD